jgi:hypothetical protein
MNNNLKEYGKEYFRSLLNNEHPSMKYGNTLIIGIQYFGKNGEIITTFTQEIKKEELIEKQVKKYYIDKHIQYIPDVKEGDIIYFDVRMGSGEYDAQVFRDEEGLYINSDNNFFMGAMDYRLNKPYWNKNY